MNDLIVEVHLKYNGKHFEVGERVSFTDHIADGAAVREAMEKLTLAAVRRLRMTKVEPEAEM